VTGLRRAAALCASALLLAGGWACGSGETLAPTADAARLPEDFVGLISAESFVRTGPDRQRLLRRQRELGVGLLRQTFDWSTIEVARGRFDLAAHDAFVADAAAAGISVMPILFNPPAFRASGKRRLGGPTPPPDEASAMARFARVLVRRYGSEGTLWKERPELSRKPIRAWQVWNEPNLPAYWGGKPSASEYGALLREVGTAIRGEDRTAEIITGGIPDSRQGVPFRDYVDGLLEAAGPEAFDVLAIHPYSRSASGVVTAVTAARRMLAAGPAPDAGLWVTEFGWASNGPRSEFTVGAKGQAYFLTTALSELARRASDLGLRGAVYYNWQDAPPYAGGKDFWGLHTGLLRRDGKPKPALTAFRATAQALSTGR
jgi:hypothetical protein